MDYLVKVVTLENKIQRHCKRGYWSSFIHGGRFRLAFLQMRYLHATGTFFALFDEHPAFSLPELSDGSLIQKTPMPEHAKDQLRTAEMLANSHDFRKVEISDLPKHYLVEVCHDLKRVIHLTSEPERLTFLLERLQYELLSRR